MKNVLFLCTGNSARSQIAETLLNYLGKDRFHAVSAGIAPKDKVHPMAITILKEMGFNTDSLRTKNLSEINLQTVDFVFTLCDHAKESCPLLPPHLMTAHWSLDDPAEITDEEASRAAFKKTVLALQSRIRLFLELPLERLERIEIQHELDNIGATE